MASAREKMTTSAPRALTSATLALTAASLAPAPALAQPTLTEIPAPPGFGSVGLANAWGVSGDGSAVIGNVASPGGPSQITRSFRWTAGSGTQDLGILPGYTAFSQALGVSFDGVRVAGLTFSSSLPARGFLWTSGSGVVDLGTPPGVIAGSSVFATDISDDGLTVVANASGPKRWSQALGWSVLLGLPGVSFNTGVTGVNADGTFACGNSDTTGSGGQPRAVRWSGATPTNLGVLVGRNYSIAGGVSADGAVIVGVSGNNYDLMTGMSQNDLAFRWTSVGGMQSLGTLAGGTTSAAYEVSGDGKVVVGTADLAASARAMVWTQVTGMVDLNAYLASRGVDLSGWTLTVAHGVSHDGSVVAGNGRLNGADRAWVVRGLGGLFCPGDFNGTGGVTPQDIFDFLNAWFTGAAGADFNGINGITPQDIFDFLNAWFVGCQ